MAQIKRYISYAKTRKPKLTPEARQLLVESYVSLRRGDTTPGSRVAYRMGSRVAYRMTVRQLEALFTGLGIELDDELSSFVEHVDKDNNGIITFEEWRDFLLLYPHEVTIENIYCYWERVYLVDIGEQAVIPEGISKHVHASKYLITHASIAPAV